MLLAEVDDERLHRSDRAPASRFAAACCAIAGSSRHRRTRHQQPRLAVAAGAFVFGAERLDSMKSNQPVVDALERDRVVRVDAGTASPASMTSEPEHQKHRGRDCTIQVDFDNTTTHVHSVPTSARATLKPFSGKSSCSGYPRRDGECPESALGFRRRTGRQVAEPAINFTDAVGLARQSPRGVRAASRRRSSGRRRTSTPRVR